MNNLLQLNQVSSRKILDATEVAIEFVKSTSVSPEGLVTSFVKTTPHPFLNNAINVVVDLTFNRPDLTDFITAEHYDYFESQTLTFEQGEELAREINTSVYVALNERVHQSGWGSFATSTLKGAVAGVCVDAIFGEHMDSDFQAEADSFFLEENGTLIRVFLNVEIENYKYEPYNTSEVLAAYAEKIGLDKK